MNIRTVVTFICMLLCASSTFAQGTPTGTISGQVLDQGGLALPGVTVTARSTAMQGERTAVSSGNGDYILPFLPPGEYTLTFALANFRTATQSVLVKIADTTIASVTLSVASVSESVTVTAATPAEFALTSTVASTYKAELIERLPVGRTVTAAALLAPGVTDNGPGGNVMISGALSFENLFLINGVVVNENLRGQPVPLYIEDAVQETKVSTGNISAEYSRFSGGVVNMLTKSGGNSFSGSYRTTFNNDSWRALTPDPNDQTIDNVVPAYEATLGGPIFRDKLWFFAAGRMENSEENSTLPYTGINYPVGRDEKRYEGKLTYALTPNHTAKLAYAKKTLDSTNLTFGEVMDRSTFYNRENPEDLLSANYTGIITPKVFVEAQYSRRQLSFIGSGSQFTDLVKGTPIWDRSRGSVRFNSPFGCAVCGSGIEERDNQNGFAKVTYFLSTRSAGSHTLVGGGDVFQERRQNDNFQSGSTYRVQATRTIIEGENIYPVFVPQTTFIDYLPILQSSKGSDLRTYSLFLNDAWKFNSHFSFNLGVRYDRHDEKDQSGQTAVDGDAFAPRLGVSWDPRGDGVWAVNAGFARYVTMVNTQVVDAGSAGGRQATFSYFYQGPSVNAGATGPYLTAEQALPILFGWFNANGGLTRTTRNAPTIPGVTTRVGDDIVAPSVDEITAGVGRTLGSRGAVRVDWVSRNYNDFYNNHRDLTTGQVADSTGRTFDLIVVNNTNKIERTYKGVNTQLSYRFGRRLDLGGNYTLSWARGNFTGEDATNGADRADVDSYPEYRQESWNWPTGYTTNDQRHKVRAWGTYRLPVSEAAGTFDLSVMQRFDSGTRSSLDGSVDPRPYVTNPGYLTPPSSVTYYFEPRGSLKHDDQHRTDLALLWAFRLRTLANSQLFFRGVLTNVFNNAAVRSFDETIFSRTNNTAYPAFNPFTEVPQRGLHYDLGPDFGKPTGVSDYQAPREFSFSVGIRF
jgi:outer membrane receptor for ferrienterochelin and colicin